MKHKRGKEKQTLVKVAQNFINYMKSSEGKKVDMSQIERSRLGSKRRVYDVINVLSGINYVERAGRAQFKWVGEQGEKTQNEEEKLSNIDTLKDFNSKIEQKLEELTNASEFSQFGFLTKEDVLSATDKGLYIYELKGPKDVIFGLENDENDNIIISVNSKEGVVNFQLI